MTQTLPAPAAPADGTPSAGTQAGPGPRRRPDLSGVRVPAGLLPAAQILTSLSIVVVTLLAQMFVVGSLSHSRAQSVGYSRFRADLANAVAPNGQFDLRSGQFLGFGAPVALLDIPQLGLEHEVVGQGTTSGVLQSGPGHLRNTVLPGQLGVSVLFGKSFTYGAPFRNLSRLRPGDVIHATTGQGRHDYQVLDVRRAGDPIPPFVADESRLTLVTADGPWYSPAGVVRVDARLTSPAVVTGPMVLTGDSDPAPEERALHGDDGAWLLLMLWTQVLLLVVVAVVWARSRWGGWQTWVAGAPVLLAVGVGLASQTTRLLPNLL